MKRWLPVLVAVAIAGGVALAASVNVTNEQVFLAMFRPWTRTTAQLPSVSAYGQYVAWDTTKSALVVSDGTTWRSASPFIGTVDYAFPALQSDNSGPVCALSNAATVPGATMGMGCVVSSNIGSDGGAVLSSDVTPTCRVSATGAAKVQLCLHVADAGTVTVADAGWILRVIN